MGKEVIFSVAGSGKTSYLIEKLNTETRTLIVVYTQANFENIQKRFPQVAEKLLQIFREWKGYFGGKYAENTRVFIIEDGHERELTAILDEEI